MTRYLTLISQTEDAVDESCDVNRTEEYHLYSKYTLDISDPRKSYFLTQVGYDLSYSRYTKLNCESESLEFRS